MDTQPQRAIDLVASLLHATSDRQRRWAAAELFKAVIGRKPTADEANRMRARTDRAARPTAPLG